MRKIDLDNRDGVSRPNVNVNNQLTSVNQAITSRKYLIVAVRSPEIRDYLVKVMRTKREHTPMEVFSIDIKSRIFVNEFLPTDTYNLLSKTKVRAKQASLKYV